MFLILFINLFRSYKQKQGRYISEIIPVFSRPYLNKYAKDYFSAPIFGVYANKSILNSNKFLKPQILGHLRFTISIWPWENGDYRSLFDSFFYTRREQNGFNIQFTLFLFIDPNDYLRLFILKLECQRLKRLKSLKLLILKLISC